MGSFSLFASDRPRIIRRQEGLSARSGLSDPELPGERASGPSSTGKASRRSSLEKRNHQLTNGVVLHEGILPGLSEWSKRWNIPMPDPLH